MFGRQVQAVNLHAQGVRLLRRFLFVAVLVCGGFFVAAMHNIQSWARSPTPENTLIAEGSSKATYEPFLPVAGDTGKDSTETIPPGQYFGFSNSSPEERPTSTSSQTAPSRVTYLPCGGMTLSVREIRGICWLGLESSTSELAVLVR
jgi:hypothetical protein